MGRRWQASLLAVVILAAAGTPVQAQPRRGGGIGPAWGGDAGLMLPAVLRAVGLTPEQDAQVRQILASHRPAFRALSQQLRGVQETTADRLFGPGAVQAADLAPLLQQSAQLREQLLQEALKVTLEVRALLTSEQLARAMQVKDRLRALRAEERSLFEGQQ